MPETSEHFQATANRLLTLALTQHVPQPVLQEILQACVETTGGVRAFLARIEPETGELVVIETAGAGWTPEGRRIRLHSTTPRSGALQDMLPSLVNHTSLATCGATRTT